MEIYSFDNVLITHAKVADDFVYKVIEAMANNKDDLIAIQPVLREFTPAFGYKQYSVPYHPGAIKYFNERKIAPRPVNEAARLGKDSRMNMLSKAFLTILLGGLIAAGIGGEAPAQTYGFATLPPGSLNHTTASAISKVMKEKGGMNVLVQPTAGDQVIIPMVGRGEVEIGITNIMETQDGFDKGQKDLRIITAVHALRTPFFVRKDSSMHTIADLKGKRVTMGYSAMRNIDVATRAMLATAGLTEADIKPILVPNVVRSADDFMAGNADMFYFAFGGPKVREADATVGGLRVLEMDEKQDVRGAQDHEMGLRHPGVARPDLHRRRKADEGLWLRQRADHVIQGEGRGDLQAPRDHGEEQGRSRRRAAGAARVLAGVRLQAIWRDVPPGRAEVLQGA